MTETPTPPSRAEADAERLALRIAEWRAAREQARNMGIIASYTDYLIDDLLRVIDDHEATIRDRETAIRLMKEDDERSAGVIRDLRAEVEHHITAAGSLIAERDRLRAEVERLTTDRNGWGDRCQAAESYLTSIAKIIERVDNRCMAVDGPVTPTLAEMTQAEISEIYRLACLARSHPVTPSPVGDSAESDDLEWRCVHGHDLCNQMYPGPDCPYCERIVKTQPPRQEPAVTDDPLIEEARRFDEGIEAFLDNFDEAMKTRAAPTQSDIERAQDLAMLSPNECGACGGRYPNPECGHLKNANHLAQPAPCIPMTENFVEAIAAALTAARSKGREAVRKRTIERIETFALGAEGAGHKVRAQAARDIIAMLEMADAVFDATPDNGDGWMPGDTAPKEHGREISIKLQQPRIRAYWDAELRCFVLSSPLHIESVCEPAEWRPVSSARLVVPMPRPYHPDVIGSGGGS